MRTRENLECFGTCGTYVLPHIRSAAFAGVLGLVACPTVPAALQQLRGWAAVCGGPTTTSSGSSSSSSGMMPAAADSPSHRNSCCSGSLGGEELLGAVTRVYRFLAHSTGSTGGSAAGRRPRNGDSTHSMGGADHSGGEPQEDVESVREMVRVAFRGAPLIAVPASSLSRPVLGAHSRRGVGRSPSGVSGRGDDGGGSDECDDEEQRVGAGSGGVVTRSSPPAAVEPAAEEEAGSAAAAAAAATGAVAPPPVVFLPAHALFWDDPSGVVCGAVVPGAPPLGSLYPRELRGLMVRLAGAACCCASAVSAARAAFAVIDPSAHSLTKLETGVPNSRCTR